MTSQELRDRTMQFAVRLVRFCRTLPPTWEARQLGSQLLSSGTSVAMNYRSATRGRSRAEFIAKLGIVVEEADESVGWLELIEQIELAKGSEFSLLLSESKELLAIFGSAQRTAKENHQRQRSVNHPINRPSPDRTSPNRTSPDSSNRTSPNRKS